MVEETPINWLRPKNDFVFKLIFGSDHEHSKQLLVAFLNDFLDIPEGQSLASVEILNPIFNQQDMTDKYEILDIKARAVGYGYVNVEIQLTNQKNIHKRSLYYGAKLYEEQLSKGADYRSLTRVVAINLMDFKFFSGDAYHSCYRLMEEYTQEPFPDLLQLHFIEMPKFIHTDKNDRKAKWLRFLTNNDNTRWDEMAKQDPIIERAVDILKEASLDPQIRMQYEAREKALKDMVSIRGDGVEEGRQEGRKEGMREIARKMLKKGMDIELIVEMTEISREEIIGISQE